MFGQDACVLLCVPSPWVGPSFSCNAHWIVTLGLPKLGLVIFSKCSGARRRLIHDTGTTYAGSLGDCRYYNPIRSEPLV